MMSINVLGMNHTAQKEPRTKKPPFPNAANQHAASAPKNQKPSEPTMTNASLSSGAEKTTATGTPNTAMTNTEALTCTTAVLANAEQILA
jgi:hypothetical protein